MGALIVGLAGLMGLGNAVSWGVLMPRVVIASLSVWLRNDNWILPRLAAKANFSASSGVTSTVTTLTKTGLSFSCTTFWPEVRTLTFWRMVLAVASSFRFSFSSTVTSTST